MRATATLADYRTGLHVSYSQVRSFLICPAKYEHRYVRGTEAAHRSVNLVFGGAVHQALAGFYARIMNDGTKMSPEELTELFRDRWRAELVKVGPPVKFGKKFDSGGHLDLGVGLLETFYEQADVPVVISVEQPFSVDLVDPATGEIMDIKLVGAFDLLAEEKGRPVIIEHKTAARRYSADQLLYDLQPSAYRYAAEQLGIDNPGLRYQLFLKTKVPAIELFDINRSNTQVVEMLETCCQVLHAVETGAFYRQRGWPCGDCEYSHCC